MQILQLRLVITKGQISTFSRMLSSCLQTRGCVAVKRVEPATAAIMTKFMGLWDIWRESEKERRDGEQTTLVTEQ